jgi:HK97 family phage major capsid protein
MKITTKQALVASLRKDFAYEGKSELAEVLAYCELEKIKIDKDAVTALFGKSAELTITKDEEEVEIVKSMEVVADDEPDADIAAKASKTKAARIESANKVKSQYAADSAKTITKGAGSADANIVKQYTIKAATGKTAFQDGDSMMEFNAAFRQRAYELYGSQYPSLFAGYKEKGFAADDASIITKTASDTVLTTGGALLGNYLKSEILWATEEWGMSRFLARNEVMIGNNTSFTRRTANPTWRALSSGAAQSTDLTYDLVTLIPKPIAALILTPMVLFEQSAAAVGDGIASALMESYFNTVDDCYFLGDGTSTYYDQVGLATGLTGTPGSGISSGSSSGSYQAAAATTWATITQGDFIRVMGAIRNANTGRCAWVMSRQAFINTALRIASTAGTYGTAGGVRPSDVLLTPQNTYLAPQMPQGASGQPHASLMGYPVFFCQRLPVATATDTVFAYFGDFQTGSIIGHRTQLEIASSTEYAFDKRALATRGFAEFAVNICGDGRSTSSQCGPIAGFQTSH